jgi:DNA-binding transcriptional LysR family regulator
MNFNAIDLNLLRVFEFLMQERSVTGAAERLGRTQSAVSHSLGKLRLLFGDELFMREGGLMNPTPRAVELGVDLSAALADIRATIDRHQSFDPSQTRRNFRVGLTDYHAMIFIPTIIQRFGEDAPYATVSFIPSTRLEVTELIQSRQLDCAILGNFEEESSNILKLQLGEDRLACAIWSGSTLLRHPLGLGPYLAATHVRVSADGMSESLADRALRDRGMQRSVISTIPNNMIIPSVLRGTDLIAHCGDGILLTLNESSEIVLVEPPIPLPAVTVSLLLHRQMTSDPATLWLRSLMEETFNEWHARKESARLVSPFVKR